MQDDPLRRGTPASFVQPWSAVRKSAEEEAERRGANRDAVHRTGVYPDFTGVSLVVKEG
jgi:hypothetical protein